MRRTTTVGPLCLVGRSGVANHAAPFSPGGAASRLACGLFSINGVLSHVNPGVRGILPLRRYTTAQAKSMWSLPKGHRVGNPGGPPPRKTLEELEASSGPIHATTVRHLLHNEHDRFRQPEEKQRIVNLLPRIQVGDLYSYSALIRELVRLDLLHEGVQFLIRIDAQGLPMTTQLFNIVIDAYAKQGLTENMTDLVDIMKSCHTQPDKFTYAILLNHYAKLADASELERLIKEMLKLKLRADEYILSGLAEGFFKSSGDLAKTLHVIDVTARAFHIEPSIAVYNIILSQLVERAQYDDAFEHFALLKSRYGVRPDDRTYVLLMRASLRQGQPDKAVELFNGLEQAAGLRPSVRHYSMLVEALAAKGEPARAVAVLNKMAAEQVRVDERLYFDYARGLLARNHVREMLEVGAHMDRLGQRLDRETALCVVRYLDQLPADYAEANLETLMQLVHFLHRHNVAYRASNIMEPYLDECKRQKKVEQAVRFMERAHKASSGPGQVKLHQTYLFSFLAQCGADASLRASLERLRNEGLYKTEQTTTAKRAKGL